MVFRDGYEPTKGRSRDKGQISLVELWRKGATITFWNKHCSFCRSNVIYSERFPEKGRLLTTASLASQRLLGSLLSRRSVANTTSFLAWHSNESRKSDCEYIYPNESMIHIANLLLIKIKEQLRCKVPSILEKDVKFLAGIFSSIRNRDWLKDLNWRAERDR